jgi:diaminohydroxyphosphoribosylaminopyrimidine deaminase/5-amino-6-(5-phosphoribosylamino)uracil reductase
VRVVLDTHGQLAAETQLARTARDAPLLVAVGPEADAADRHRLEAIGAELYTCIGKTHAERFASLLDELGRRGMTNVLLEGGGTVLGSARDADEIDEVHVFVAPRLIGGDSATAACLGLGAPTIETAKTISFMRFESLDGDLHVWGRVAKS